MIYVCVQYNTWKYYTERKPKNTKWGRPGNEAIIPSQSVHVIMLTDQYHKQHSFIPPVSSMPVLPPCSALGLQYHIIPWKPDAQTGPDHVSHFNPMESCFCQWICKNWYRPVLLASLLLPEIAKFGCYALRIWWCLQGNQYVCVICALKGTYVMRSNLQTQPKWAGISAQRREAFWLLWKAR